MTDRVHGRAVFDRFRAEGRRFRHGAVWCTWIDEPTGPRPRIAYAVGRRVGGAVTRNRVRRRLRAIVAGEVRSLGLPPGTYLIGAQPGAASASYQQLARDASALFAQLRRAADG